MSSSNLNNLVAFYRTKVSALTDTESRLNALWALENYEGAAGAYGQAAERGPTSYSIHNRSFSFESKMAAKAAMDMAREDLMSFISDYGNTERVDYGGTIW